MKENNDEIIPISAGNLSDDVEELEPEMLHLRELLTELTGKVPSLSYVKVLIVPKEEEGDETESTD